MRKLLIPALLLASVAAPAAAQHRDYDSGRGRNAAIGQQIDQIERQIDSLHQRRLISSNEARRLSREASQIEQRHQRYRRDGLSQREHEDLRDRIQDLRQRLRSERQEGREDRRDDRRDDRRNDRW